MRLAPVPATPRHGSSPYRRRIGVLGGSFNPPHAGHLHISDTALRRLRLDEVWWLVAPQNPLKDPQVYRPLAERLAACARLTASRRKIKPLALEQEFATLFTVQTMRFLRQRCPRTQFVWLMGTDNLVSCHHWQQWPRLFSENHIAIFDRAPYIYHRGRCKVATRFRRRFLSEDRAHGLIHRPLPAWTVIHSPLMAISSTLIRQQQQEPPC